MASARPDGGRRRRCRVRTPGSRKSWSGSRRQIRPGAGALASAICACAMSSASPGAISVSTASIADRSETCGSTPKKRQVREVPEPRAVPGRPHDMCSMDVIADKLRDGRSSRTMNVLGDVNREGLALEVDVSLPAARMGSGPAGTSAIGISRAALHGGITDRVHEVGEVCVVRRRITAAGRH